MEKLEHEFDPLTGLLTRSAVTEEGALVIRKDADLEPNLEYATALRNSDEYSADGIKRGFFHAVHVPVVAQLQLLQIGIDVMTASPKTIIAGMRRIGMDHFITTRRRV